MQHLLVVELLFPAISELLLNTNNSLAGFFLILWFIVMVFSLSGLKTVLSLLMKALFRSGLKLTYMCRWTIAHGCLRLWFDFEHHLIVLTQTSFCVCTQRWHVLRAGPNYSGQAVPQEGGDPDDGVRFLSVWVKAPTERLKLLWPAFRINLWPY